MWSASFSLLFCLFVFQTQAQTVEVDIEIDAPSDRVWDCITNPDYAKVLGAEFDEGAFVESDWEMGSQVHFKYEPDRLINSGTITKLVEEELIQIDYDLGGFAYQEVYTIVRESEKSVLGLKAGPYTADFEAQQEVWGNWLTKVKEICEVD